MNVSALGRSLSWNRCHTLRIEPTDRPRYLPIPSATREPPCPRQPRYRVGHFVAAHRVALQLRIRVILARLLAPEEFGQVAMLLMFLSIARNITEFSLGAALVQRQKRKDAYRNAVFRLVGSASALFALLSAVLAPLVGQFSTSQEVPVTRVLGLSRVPAFQNAVEETFFLRKTDYRTLGIARIAAASKTGIGGPRLLSGIRCVGTCP